MIIADAQQKRQNRTVVLHLGNNLMEYESWLSTEGHSDELLRRVEIADDLNWCHLADGHYAGCQRRLRFTHHGAYKRGLLGFDGQLQKLLIKRVRCRECGAVFTILPSFVVRYKRWHTDAIEKLMVLLFITEDSYRLAGVSQAFAIDAEQSGSWAALERTTGEAISPMALWRLVQWFGQLSPAQLNLALGVEPPSHVIEDEKHLCRRLGPGSERTAQGLTWPDAGRMSLARDDQARRPLGDLQAPAPKSRTAGFRNRRNPDP